MANVKNKEVVTLPGSRGQDIVVCACHASLVNRFKWHVLATGYAARSTWHPRTMIYMHRLIAKATPGRVVDHINGDKLYNVCWNLRVVTQHENMANARSWRHNTSGYRGVAWHKQQKCWRAYINLEGRQKSLGLYATIEEAAAARKEAEAIYFKEYSYSERPPSVV